MTDTERGLLNAILDDIDDDDVRLVYADFLEERGDPRGEFIRLQVLRARDAERYNVSPREGDLLKLHGEEWLTEARPFDPQKVELTFDRGFIAFARVVGGTDDDLGFLRRVPGLRSLSLETCRGGTVGLGDIAALLHLREFTFDRDTEIGVDGLAVLEALPAWTRVCCDGGYPDDAAWAAFQERRIAKFDGLHPPERRKGAVRFLAALVGGREPFTEVHLSQEALSDAEMRFFREIPELEVLRLFEPFGLTDAGLRHLAGLPRLRSVEVYKAEIADIRPMAECPTLEVLKIGGRFDAELNDEGTEGLERLTNLRTLHLWRGDLGDATVRRLGPLRRLADLSLDLRAVEDERCLEALSGLTALESLSLSEFASLSGLQDGLGDGVLRYLATLTKLRVLNLHLPRGSGGGLRHLSALTELRFLALSGPAVTDAGIAHLGTLRNLRTLMAQPSEISEAGARALAERLPGVTIITLQHVVKSPRRSLAFIRQQVSEWAFLLIPEDWKPYYGPGYAREDGWEDVSSWSGGIVGPAKLWFHAAEKAVAPTSEEEVERIVNGNRHLNPRVLERDLVRWDGWETASAVFEIDRTRYLACAAVRDGRSFTLTCEAPPSRFEEFRPLFLLVARSVRLGEAAACEAKERVEIPVAEFATFVG